MKKILLPVTIISLCGALVACATTTTTILNNPDGSYTMKASDSSEADALSGGIKKANEFCAAQHKTTIVHSQTSKYNSTMDPNVKSAINTVAAVTAASNNNNYMLRQDTSKDYMVTIKFKCE